VEIASNADEALFLLKKENFHLILLDIGLPGKDGYALLADLQSLRYVKDIPIICLTGKTNITDKITAFSLGVDDYLVKPFDPLELRARVDAKLIRTYKNAEEKSISRVGNLEINHNTHRVFIVVDKQKHEAVLTQTEYKILSVLARRPEQIFSRDQLLVAVWGEDARVTDRVVDTHVCSLRKKLGDKAPLIKAVAGVGYKLELTEETQSFAA
jgi:two-component system phosphate regulon response regulator PhoB